MKRIIIEDPVNIGAWRSLEARLLWEQEVPSSNLGAPTNKINNLRDADFTRNRRFCVLCSLYVPHLHLVAQGVMRGKLFLSVLLVKRSKVRVTVGH